MKEISKVTQKYLQHQAETERLRQIKIEIVDRKRQKANIKVKVENELDQKGFQEYKSRVKEILEEQHRKQVQVSRFYIFRRAFPTGGKDGSKISRRSSLKR